MLIACFKYCYYRKETQVQENCFIALCFANVFRHVASSLLLVPVLERYQFSGIVYFSLAF